MSILTIIPIHNLNGSGKSNLLHNGLDAKRAVEAAKDALALARPHPRDYPNGDYSEARKQWDQLESLVYDVAKELDHYLLEIADQ